MFEDNKEPIESYRQLDYQRGVEVSYRMNYILGSFQELVLAREDQNTIIVKVCELLSSYTYNYIKFKFGLTITLIVLLLPDKQTTKNKRTNIFWKMLSD